MERRACVWALGMVALLMAVSAEAFDDPQQALDQWRGDEALQMLDDSPEKEDAVWQRQRGEALLQLGQLEEAVEHLEEAVELDPHDGRHHFTLMRVLSEKIEDAGVVGSMRMARQMRSLMEEAVENDPDNPEYRFALLQYYLFAPGIAGGTSSRVDEQYEALGSFESHWQTGADALQLLDDDESDRAYPKLIEAWNQGEGIDQFGILTVVKAQEREDWETAYQVLEEMLEQDPKLPIALYQVGRTAVLAEQKLTEGRKALERYSDLSFIPHGNPPREEAFWRLGQIHLQQGNHEEARDAWDSALDLDPDHEAAREALKELDRAEEPG